MTRISTVETFNRTISSMIDQQGKLADIQKQISSGRKSDTFAGLGSEISRVITLESTIKSTKRFISGNTIVESRLKTMDVAVAKIEDIVTQLKQNIILERSNGSSLNITDFAKSALSRVADSLNVKQTGRALFAGSKTNTDPVDGAAILVNSNVINDVATSNYYKGDDLSFSIRSTEQLEVNYGIKANDTAFQNVIAALHKAINSEGGAENSGEALDKAMVFADKAIDGLARVRTQIYTDIITLREVNSQHETVVLQLDEALNDIVSTDIVAASITVSLNQAVLTASMQTFARISRLTLADFLR